MSADVCERHKGQSAGRPRLLGCRRRHASGIPSRRVGAPVVASLRSLLDESMICLPVQAPPDDAAVVSSTVFSIVVRLPSLSDRVASLLPKDTVRVRNYLWCATYPHTYVDRARWSSQVYISPCGRVRTAFSCHECGKSFDAAVANQWGMYEFVRCPNCGSARTTLAPTASRIDEEPRGEIDEGEDTHSTNRKQTDGHSSE